MRARLVEVNAETDFVARNDTFKEFVKRAAELALKLAATSTSCWRNRTPHGGASVQETATELVAKIGENISVRRAMHCRSRRVWSRPMCTTRLRRSWARSACWSRCKSTADKTKLAALGKQIAMHIAAAAPLALTPEHLSAEVVARERAMQADLARQSGKPEAVIEKMIEGRMRKFYEETVLLSQTFVIDGETQVGKVLEKASKDLGAPVEIEGFVASRSAKASRRSTATSPTKSTRWRVTEPPEGREWALRRNSAGSC
jgi:elongation factor Ts